MGWSLKNTIFLIARDSSNTFTGNNSSETDAVLGPKMFSTSTCIIMLALDNHLRSGILARTVQFHFFTFLLCTTLTWQFFFDINQNLKVPKIARQSLIPISSLPALDARFARLKPLGTSLCNSLRQTAAERRQLESDEQKVANWLQSAEQKVAGRSDLEGALSELEEEQVEMEASCVLG